MTHKEIDETINRLSKGKCMFMQKIFQQVGAEEKQTLTNKTTKTMDNRLDFYNTVNDFSKTLTDDDALLVLSHNKKQGDCIAVLAGDWEILSQMLSTDGYVNTNEQNINTFENIKKSILNTAYNICANDVIVKDRFMEGLKELKQ